MQSSQLWRNVIQTSLNLKQDQEGKVVHVIVRCRQPSLSKFESTTTENVISSPVKTFSSKRTEQQIHVIYIKVWKLPRHKGLLVHWTAVVQVIMTAVLVGVHNQHETNL
jgi:hypothetical protein